MPSDETELLIGSGGRVVSANFAVSEGIDTGSLTGLATCGGAANLLSGPGVAGVVGLTGSVVVELIGAIGSVDGLASGVVGLLSAGITTGSAIAVVGFGLVVLAWASEPQFAQKDFPAIVTWSLESQF